MEEVPDAEFIHQHVVAEARLQFMVKAEYITPERHFRDFSSERSDLCEYFYALEDIFEIEIPDSEWPSIETIAQVEAVVLKKLQEKAQ